MENPTLIPTPETDGCRDAHAPIDWNDLIATVLPILSGDGDVSDDQGEPIVWDDVIASVASVLAGDAEIVETAGTAQFGHFGSGIRVTLEHGELLMSSSYSLLGGDASVVADQMREIVLAVEMATGRTAEAVRFDQPGLAVGDIAGRQRVHGYAVLTASRQHTLGAGRTMALHPSLLAAFDAHVERRNP